MTQARPAKEEGSGRLAALKGIQAALSGVQAGQAVALNGAQGGSPGSVVGVNLSYGSQSSTSTQTQTARQSEGSQLTAGNNLTLRATESDINVQGSGLKAGNDMTLSAARDVNLVSSENTQQLVGKSERHGGSAGVGVNFGQGANGISLNAGVNKGKGHEAGNGTTHTETTADAGNRLSIISGRDTTLKGAQAGANQVTLDVGRNLWLASEQDTDNYDSKQTNASVSLGGGSGSLSLSRDRMHSKYASVQEQTGIFAGRGGFDITAGNHTQLDGSVIASTATADKNKLSTGTLGWRDIRNEAEYQVEHQSAGISSGGSIGGQFVGNMANGLLTGVNRQDSAGSTTKAAISGGEITVRDRVNQQQDVADLSRDAEHANQTLSPIFDKEKEQNRIREAQLIGEIGGQAADIARTQGQIAGEKAKKDPAALKAAKEQLAGKGNRNPTDEEIAKQAYNTAMAPYGTGSSLQRGIQAATAAIQGLAGGDLAKAIAGGSVPYIANVIGNSGLDDTGKVMAHAAVNAALAAAQGNSALAGAAGAATAELAGMIALDVYGRSPGELSETEKQTVSTLATLAAGLAGGLAGNGTADAVVGAQAGQTTVSNNLFGGTETGQEEKAREHGADVLSCADNPSGEACQRGLAENKAYAGALATGGVALLPGSAQAMWALGAGANAGAQYAKDGKVNPVNSVVAGWTNVITIGNSLTGTVIWNAAGGALTNQINGDNPLTGAITNGAGSALGYGAGKLISSGTNVAGKWITGGWDPKFNPDLLKYTEIKGQLGISKEMLPSKYPSAAGNVGASYVSEKSGNIIQEQIKSTGDTN